MALSQSQITLINSLVDATTITESQGRDLLSSSFGFNDTQITFLETLGLTDEQLALMLATDASTQEGIEQEIAQAKKYLMAEDLYNARKWVTLAEMTMASLPDHKIGTREIRYRDQLHGLSVSLDKMEGKSPNSQKNKRISARYIR